MSPTSALHYGAHKFAVLFLRSLLLYSHDILMYAKQSRQQQQQHYALFYRNSFGVIGNRVMLHLNPTRKLQTL